MVANRNEVTIERRRKGFGPLVPTEHLEDVDGMATIRIGRNRRLTRSQPDEGGSEDRRRCRQAESVLKRVAVRQECDAGTGAVIEIDRPE